MGVQPQAGECNEQISESIATYGEKKDAETLDKNDARNFSFVPIKETLGRVCKLDCVRMQLAVILTLLPTKIVPSQKNTSSFPVSA